MRRKVVTISVTVLFLANVLMLRQGRAWVSEIGTGADYIRIVSNPVPDGQIVVGPPWQPNGWEPLAGWEELDHAIIDPSGDGAYIDYYNLSIAHDSTYFYLLLHSLSSGSASEMFVLYFDTDVDNETGCLITKLGGGIIGADYKLSFTYWEDEGVYEWKEGVGWFLKQKLEPEDWYGWLKSYAGYQYIEMRFPLESLDSPSLMELYLIDEVYAQEDFAPNQGRILYALKIPVVGVTLRIDPNTLNLNSKGKWITAYIELPESYNVRDIDASTVKLNGLVSAELHPTEIGDYDGDNIPDLMVKFDRTSIIGSLNIGEATLTITGEVNGIPFEGSDIIRVIGE